MYGLGILSDEQLINAYKQAIENELEKDFINILAEEMSKRELKTLSFLKRAALFIPKFTY